DRSCDLRIAFIENLRRSPESISSGQHVVSQLSFGERSRWIQLLSSHFEDRLTGRELPKCLEKRIRNRVVVSFQIVIKFNGSVNFVRIEAIDSSGGQLERECKNHVA